MSELQWFQFFTSTQVTNGGFGAEANALNKIAAKQIAAGMRFEVLSSGGSITKVRVKTEELNSLHPSAERRHCAILSSAQNCACAFRQNQCVPLRLSQLGASSQVKPHRHVYAWLCLLLMTYILLTSCFVLVVVCGRCKRILISDGYLQAIAQPNVQLVTDKIVEITPRGVVTCRPSTHNGASLLKDTVVTDLDVLVYATGFETHEFCGNIDVRGANGCGLREVGVHLV